MCVSEYFEYGMKTVYSIFFPNLNVLVAISKDMWAVKLCTNEILQFLTGGAG